MEAALICPHCRASNPPAAKFCLQCGNLQGAAPKVGLARDQKVGLAIGIGVVMALSTLILIADRYEKSSFSVEAPRNPRSLTSEHRNAIQMSLRKIGYPMPQSLEINDTGFLVATFELRGRVSPLSVKTFAEDSIMAIREAMLPFKIVEAYRVTLDRPQEQE